MVGGSFISFRLPFGGAREPSARSHRLDSPGVPYVPDIGEGTFIGVFSSETVAKEAMLRSIFAIRYSGDLVTYRYTAFKGELDEFDIFEDYADVWNYPVDSGRGGRRSFWVEYADLPPVDEVPPSGPPASFRNRFRGRFRAVFGSSANLEFGAALPI
jgi:hypothetical protein